MRTLSALVCPARARPAKSRPAGLALALAVSLVPVVAPASPARAGSYEFVPAPQADLNRMYRVDTVTGEVVSCQYGLQETGGGIGVTVCFPPGEGAGPQPPSEYGLVATRHTREAGVFRVNHRTGAMSVCFVLLKREQVVCTPQANATGDGPAEAPPAGAPPARPGMGTSPQTNRP